MSNHLSEDQFAKCIVVIGRKELEHLRQCPECSAELERFGSAVTAFRSALRNRADDRAASHAFSIRPAIANTPKWRWALVAALFVVVMVIPFFISKPQSSIENASTQMDPEALMRAVNLHLSRTIPAPMEPMMALIPNEEPKIESGGLQ